MLRFMVYVIAAVMLLINYAYGAYEGPLPADPMVTGKGVWQIDEAKNALVDENNPNTDLGTLMSKWTQCGKVSWQFSESQSTVWVICDATQTLPVYNPEMITAIRTYKQDSDMRYVQVKEYRWMIPVAINQMNGKATINFPYFQVVWGDNHTLTLGGELYDYRTVTKGLLRNRLLEKAPKDYAPHVYYLWAEKMYGSPSDWQPYQ